MVQAPVGYEKPLFPSLYWPLGPSAEDFNNSFLYYTKDVWEFTTVWTIIFMTGVYTLSGSLMIINHYLGLYRHPVYKIPEMNVNKESTIGPNYHHYFIDSLFHGNRKVIIFTFLLYIVVGAFQGLLAGSIVGILIAAIYTAAQFRVSTWMPFVYSIIITLYNISSSYSFTVKNL